MPGKQMDQAEDAVAWELSGRGWSFRRIGEQLERSHRSIPAAIERHQRRLDDGDFDRELALDDARIVQWERFRAWVEEGRRHGWDHLLVSGLDRKE